MISTRYKRRILCYLLSHVQALSLAAAEVVLLKLVENVSDKAKAQILTPVITDLVTADVPLQGSIQEDLTSLWISSFDSSVTNDFNEARYHMCLIFPFADSKYLVRCASSTSYCSFHLLGKGTICRSSPREEDQSMRSYLGHRRPGPRDGSLSFFHPFSRPNRSISMPSARNCSQSSLLKCHLSFTC